jgi:hypothetical protein
MYQERNMNNFDLDGDYQLAIDNKIHRECRIVEEDDSNDLDRWITPEQELVPMWPPHDLFRHLPDDVQLKIMNILVKSVEAVIDRQKYAIRHAKTSYPVILHIHYLGEKYRQIRENTPFSEFLFEDGWIDIHPYPDYYWENLEVIFDLNEEIEFVD